MMRRSLLSLAIHAILVLSEGVWALGLRSSSAAAAGGDGLAPSFAHGAAREVVPPHDDTAGAAAEDRRTSVSVPPHDDTAGVAAEAREVVPPHDDTAGGPAADTTTQQAAGPDLKTAVADLCKECGRWAGRKLVQCLSADEGSCFDFRAFSTAMLGTDYYAPLDDQVDALCNECHKRPSWNGMSDQPCENCAHPSHPTADFVPALCNECHKKPSWNGMPDQPCRRCGAQHSALCNECHKKPSWNGMPDQPCRRCAKRAADVLDHKRPGAPVNVRVLTLAGGEELFERMNRCDTVNELVRMIKEKAGDHPGTGVDLVPARETSSGDHTVPQAPLAGARRMEGLLKEFGEPGSQELRLTVMRSFFPEAWLRTVRDELRGGGAQAEEAHSALVEFCRGESSTRTINRYLVAFLLGKFVFYLPPMPRRGQNSEDLKILLRTGELRIPSWSLGPHEAGLDGHVRAARAALEGLRVLIGAGDVEAGADENGLIAGDGQELARGYREAVAEQLVDLVGAMAEQARGRDHIVDWIYSLAWETFDFLSETTGYTWRMPDPLAEAFSRRG